MPRQAPTCTSATSAGTRMASPSCAWVLAGLMYSTGLAAAAGGRACAASPSASSCCRLSAAPTTVRGGRSAARARLQVVAVVVELVVQHRIRFLDLQRQAQRPRRHLRRHGVGQRRNTRSPARTSARRCGVADAQQHMDEGIVGMAVDDQAVVDPDGAGARAGQRKQRPVADGGVRTVRISARASRSRLPEYSIQICGMAVAGTGSPPC